jgi:hypothetical protein
MNRYFDHEKLEVYQESLAFVAWLEPLPQKFPKAIAARDLWIAPAPPWL